MLSQRRAKRPKNIRAEENVVAVSTTEQANSTKRTRRSVDRKCGRVKRQEARNERKQAIHNTRPHLKPLITLSSKFSFLILPARFVLESDDVAAEYSALDPLNCVHGAILERHAVGEINTVPKEPGCESRTAPDRKICECSRPTDVCQHALIEQHF